MTNLKPPPIKPEIYQWTGVTVSKVLGLSSALLLFFGGNAWYNILKKPLFALPLGVLAPFQIAAIVLSGFGSRIVMGNVSGNPAVKPARKMYAVWLVMHGLWLLLFAGLHLAVPAMIVSVLTWGFGTVTIQKFFNVDPKAGSRALFFYLLTSYWMVVNGFLISLNNL